MKAIDIILRDHRAAEELFTKFKQASVDERESMETVIFDALTVHERMEDTHFYPVLREKMNDASVITDLEVEQKELEMEVLAARALPGDKSERILSIMDTVLTHAQREESEILPEAEATLDPQELEELGKKMEPDSAVANEQ